MYTCSQPHIYFHNVVLLHTLARILSQSFNVILNVLYQHVFHVNGPCCSKHNAPVTGNHQHVSENPEIRRDVRVASGLLCIKLAAVPQNYRLLMSSLRSAVLTATVWTAVSWNAAWTSLGGSGAGSRAFHAMTTLTQNTAVVFGGGSLYSPLNDAWLLDVSKWRC